MKTYFETGSTTTPRHGRGQQTLKKNSRFDEFEEQELANLKTPERRWRQLHLSNELPSTAPIDALEAKYKLNKEKILCTNQKQSVKADSIIGMILSRKILCMHFMTGRVSKAFKDKDAEPQLDKEKVQSICEYGCKRFGCKTEDVRKAMIARINNIYKAEKVKEKASKE